MAAAEMPPAGQPWKKQPATRSPSAMPETPGPTAVTSPAPSEFGTRGKANPRCAGARTVLRSR